MYTGSSIKLILGEHNESIIAPVVFMKPEFKQTLESTLKESLQLISSSNKKVSLETSASRNGSIVILIATDVPLLPHQLRWLSKRAIIGLTATGSKLRTSSGDFVLSFSTATQVDLDSHAAQETEFLPIEELGALITPLTEAIVESHFQAIVAANRSSHTNAAPRQ
jgi:L-aminopeptidase/D-esterase-like protein